MNRRSCITSIAALAAWPFARAADDYPTRPIRMIVPWPAGGIADAATRRVCALMEPILSQQVIVENKGGASGMIGTDLVAKSKPDGYTLLRGDMVTHSVNPHLFKNVPYDPLKDFAPISGHGRGVMLMVVHPEVKAKTFAEFIALAKAKPGTLHHGAAIGTPAHLAAELMKHLTGTDLVHVPYKGEGPALTDLMGGQIQFMFSFVNAAGPFVTAGKLRALMITRAQRVPMLPDVPAAMEVGQPGLEMSAWGAFFAPAGTPRPIIDKLNAAIARAMAHADMQAFLAAAGSEAMIMTPEQMSTFLVSEMRRWGDVVRRSGARVD